MRRIISLLLFFVLIVSSFPSLVSAEDINSARLDGKDRFEVAVNVSKAGWKNGSETVIISNYQAFSDALSAAPIAFRLDAPILLTEAPWLTQATKDEIIRLKAKKVILIGGPVSISEAVEKELEEIGIDEIKRIGGLDRFEVSYNIAKELGSSEKAIITNGFVFADALSVAPYAAKNGYPVLLTRSSSLPASTSKALNELNISETIVLGGEKSVENSIFNILPKPERIGGKDRYEVSANVANILMPSSNKAFIATGLTFADALTGSVLAAKEDAPMLLIHSQSIFKSEPIRKVIENRKLANLFILGGKTSVPEDIYLMLTGQKPILSLYGKVIVLDPGHGGYDPGAVKNGYKEVTLNNQFTIKLARNLENLGATVRFTRDPKLDIYVSLEERANIANRINPDLFISIHHDASTNSSARGLSTHYSTYRPAIETKDVYVLSGNKKYEFIREDTENRSFIVKYGSSTLSLSYDGPNIAYDPTPSKAATDSKILAEKLTKALEYPSIPITKIYSSTGSRDGNLYVTRWTKMPSVLVELGFISNSQEVLLLANEKIQAERAFAMAEEIKKFLSH